MITLFRRIRKKLIATGTISKYLLYAIGEILLVVIGILIALQVNNWNEQRVLNNQLQTYFEQIRDELSANQEYLNSRIGDQEAVVRLNRRSLLLLKTENPDSLKQLEHTLGALGTAWTTSYNYPILTEFLNSGLLPKVQNADLKEKISELNLFINNTETFNSFIQTQYLNNIEPYLIETFNYQSIALESYQPYIIKGGPGVDYTQFSNDLKLWNLLTLKLEISTYYLEAQKNIKDHHVELIILLDNQLEN